MCVLCWRRDKRLWVRRKTKAYDVRGSSRAGPEITRLLLARAATVGLPNDVAAVAGWQNTAAVSAGAKTTCLLEIAGHGESADGEEGENRESSELHFRRVVVYVREEVWSLVGPNVVSSG